jgi:hypothetical protein
MRVARYVFLIQRIAKTYFFNLKKLTHMGLKHLFGYTLIIAGIALLPLLIAFYANRQVFDSLFLIALAGSAFASFIVGSIILKKLS